MGGNDVAVSASPGASEEEGWSEICSNCAATFSGEGGVSKGTISSSNKSSSPLDCANSSILEGDSARDIQVK